MKNKSLYFIPILMKTFEQGEIEASVESAIKEIQSLGELEEYKTGFEQFKIFLKEGLGENSNKITKGNDELRKRFETILDQIETSSILQLELYKDGKLLDKFSIEDDIKVITNVGLGKYLVGFENGRVLWDGEINKDDIVLDKIDSYKMAASIDGIEVEPSKTIELLKNEMEMKIFAGFESGRIKFIKK